MSSQQLAAAPLNEDETELRNRKQNKTKQLLLTNTSFGLAMECK
jgi:hypothetical protein